MSERVLYLGWLGQENLGDELLFQVFREGVTSRARSRGFELSVEGFAPERVESLQLREYALVVLGGGSLLHLPFWLRLCRQAQDFGVPVASWATGVDARFGGTVEAFREQTRMPAELAKRVHATVSAMRYVSCRGPYSAAFLELAGVDRGRVQVVADPGLFCASPSTARADPDHVMVNWGTARGDLIGGDEGAVARALGHAIERLLADGRRVTVCSLWPEDVAPAAALARAFDGRISVAGPLRDVASATALLADCSVSVNLKLHANVLSAATGRPFIALAYRTKCLDFAETVQSRDLCIPTDAVTPESILRRVAWAQEHAGEIAARFVAARRAHASSLAAAYDALVDLVEKKAGGESRMASKPTISVSGRLSPGPARRAPAPTPLLIAMPTASGRVESPCVTSVVSVVRDFERRGIGVGFTTIDFAEVATARNLLCARFLARSEATHLLFVDDDMVFEPSLVRRLWEHPGPFVGAACPRRELDLEAVVQRAREGQPVDRAIAASTGFNIEPKAGARAQRGFLEVTSIGTGIVLIARGVLETMIARGAVSRLTPGRVAREAGVGTHYHDFFGRIEEAGRELSEDVSFCRRWIGACGGTIHACVDRPVTHLGRHGYRARYADRD